MKSRPLSLLLVALGITLPAAFAGFAVDSSPQPASHPPLAPVSGSEATTNPPSLIWRHDSTAESYVLELSREQDFSAGVIRVSGVKMPFYNHAEPLAPGVWFWRYRVVRPGGAQSDPSAVRSFTVSERTPALPVPPVEQILHDLPGHPRIFVRPEQVEEFRARRLHDGREAWSVIQAKADALLALAPPRLPELLPLPERLPSHRQQVFWVQGGSARVPSGYGRAELVRDAGRADLLSLAYLISGEARYAEAARRWALFVAPFRMDYHLKSVAERGQHDSVVYAYEKGLMAIALTYDRLHARLSPAERQQLIDHVDYHGAAAFHWIQQVMHIHLEYQDSHAQQCMHALLPTALALAGDSAQADAWVAYLVPQYANRIAWTSEDGGYFEGQNYALKFSYILESLCALRSATGIDLFQKPSIRNSADFWLYAMSLNYWWPHWGDNLPLVNPFGNAADAYITALLASATENRFVRWWSEATPSDPQTIPLNYVAASGITAAPPIAVPQARVFPQTGVVAAFDRLYDHGASRLFFRSSPWGGYSHAHADQNSFVIHRGREILAADIGYYSYFGDENYTKFSTQTIAHNSVLVNGQGQINDLAGAGEITAFFNAPEFVFVSGDASKAYGPALQRFRRDVIFLRPDLFVVADELEAKEPAKWTWILNTFTPVKFDAAAREFTVRQQHQALWGRHVFPQTIAYDCRNDRLSPHLTKEWTRYTEAFPEPWRFHAEATGRQMRFLTIMKAFDADQEPGARVVAAEENLTTLAVRLNESSRTHEVLMRADSGPGGELAAFGAKSDGRCLVLTRSAAGQLAAWNAVAATAAEADGAKLFHSSVPLSVSAELSGAAAALQVATATDNAGALTLTLPFEPRTILVSTSPHARPATTVPFTREGGAVRFEIPAGEATFWIDPHPASAQAPAFTLTIEDEQGTYAVQLEGVLAANGQWAGFASFTPRQPGLYEITSGDSAAEFLVQDRWDARRSTRGVGRASGLIGPAAEFIVRSAPRARPLQITAKLKARTPARTINLLENGDCEAGLPGFPPRGWTVRHGPNMEYASRGEQGWPGWTTEDAAGGKAALKFTRPKNRLKEWRAPYRELARDSLSVLAPPVRLREPGRYLLKWKTRGTATHAKLVLTDAHGLAREVPLSPHASWEETQVEFDLPAGYTTLSWEFRAGGRDDQVLWLDEVSLAAVHPE